MQQQEQPRPQPARRDPARGAVPGAGIPAPATATTTSTPARATAQPASEGFSAAAPRARKAARRTRVVVRRVAPWSVLKFSLIFYFCVMLIVYFALLIIYMILSAAGAMDSLAKVLGWVFGSGTSTLGPTPVTIDGKQVFTILFLAGCLFTVIWAVINVFVAFLYNLISDVVGGIEITLAEKTDR